MKDVVGGSTGTCFGAWTKRSPCLQVQIRSMGVSVMSREDTGRAVVWNFPALGSGLEWYRTRRCTGGNPVTTNDRILARRGYTVHSPFLYIMSTSSQFHTAERSSCVLFAGLAWMANSSGGAVMMSVPLTVLALNGLAEYHNEGGPVSGRRMKTGRPGWGTTGRGRSQNIG